ncbi:hypothetical protein HK098_007775 [Nowakowskiella sp. JEL0407]|nr:hypothetical protein HK098_007775 [Nowakowskiella sp. JEL0407]
METDEGLLQWLENIDTFGIGVVDGVPPTHEDTAKLAKRITFIRETHYGKYWSFTADMAHADTAYTNMALPAHTDTTYFTEPIGIQLFHITNFQGRGGESLYVDGFHIAKKLKKVNPDAYDLLSRFPVPTHSAGDPKFFMTPQFSRGVPILNHDPLTGALRMVRFNNDDRSVLDARFLEKPMEVEAFYDALREWTKLLRSPKNEVYIKLEPGRVAAVNNWRVLHGRSEFDGKRTVGGCYIGMDDFKSRLRILKEGNDIYKNDL